MPNDMTEARGAWAKVRYSLGPELQLAAWGGSINLLWEFLQSPLYADFHKGTWHLIHRFPNQSQKGQTSAT
jgi:hypothetical protein